MVKLKTVQITHYKSVDNSGVFTVEPGATALVGKNESGKTSMLQALRRMNAVDNAVYEPTKHYPRKGLNRYMAVHETMPATVSMVVYSLEPEDIDAIAKSYGPKVLLSEDVECTMNYKNEGTVRLQIDEAQVVRNLVGIEGLAAPLPEMCRKEQTLEALEAAITGHEAVEGHAALLKRVKQLRASDLGAQVWETCLATREPQYLYFDEYGVMSGDAKLDELEQHIPTRDTDFEGQAKRAHLQGLSTLLDLLDLASTKPKDLKADDGKHYEEHKARLESAALDITEQVFEYWSQNQDTEVEFDVSSDKTFYVRVKGRHKVTVPFVECSKGFIWFFSFLARFNGIATGGKRLVLLLDEPGLNLHAAAQSDLLRLIDERLVKQGHQVIYTTHSPFMIHPEHLHRVRTVEDHPKQGTLVSSDFLVTDPATAFPLQAALGYSLAQTLFIGPKVVLVEGPSDILYLQAMSAHLEAKGRPGLDDSWVITPTGGSGKLAAFVTLLGSNKLKVVVLMDFTKADQQVVDNILQSKVIKDKAIVKPTEFTGTNDADIEDLFDADTYIALVTAAYPHVNVTAATLPPGTRLVKRVEKVVLGGKVKKFNHFLPSKHITDYLDKKGVPDDVLDRFEKLFERVNKLG